MEDSLYKEIILELYRHPLNKKKLVDFDVEERGFNPACGDDLIVQIKFDPEEKVADIGYHGDGCAISEAAMSLVTDEVKGKTKQEIMRIGKSDVINLLGVEIIPTRVQCMLLGLKTIQQGIKNNES